jgi:hypothetical protein
MVPHTYNRADFADIGGLAFICTQPSFNSGAAPGRGHRAYVSMAILKRHQ